jgi:hypothetical protein
MSYLANGNAEPFTQVEVRGQWLQPVIMNLGRPNVTLYENGADCPTSSTCDVFGYVSAGSAWNPSFLAVYTGSKWRYSIVDIAGDSRDLFAMSMSCATGECWIAGTANRGFITSFAP